MSQPAARITDMHVCPMITGVVPHVGGPISLGAPTVLIGMMPAARIGDMAICVGPPDVVAMGAFNVLVSGMPAARMGDLTVHGGTITLGCFTVLIGMAGSGSAGAASPGSPRAGVTRPGMGGTPWYGHTVPCGPE